MMMKWIKAYAAGQNKTAKESDTRLREVAAATEAALLEQLGTGPDGLTEEQAEAVRERTGPNPLAPALGLTALPVSCFGALAVIVGGYILLESLAKALYIRRYHSWL